MHAYELGWVKVERDKCIRYERIASVAIKRGLDVLWTTLSIGARAYICPSAGIVSGSLPRSEAVESCSGAASSGSASRAPVAARTANCSTSTASPGALLTDREAVRPPRLSAYTDLQPPSGCDSRERA